MPGRIFLKNGVHVGAGTIIENASNKDLIIPEKTQIPARSYVVNGGDGNPVVVGG